MNHTSPRYVVAFVLAATLRVAPGNAGQAQAPIRAKQPGSRSIELNVVRNARGVPHAPTVSAQPRPDVVRAANFTEMNVAVAGRRVAVSGEVQIYDTVPGLRYIWLLRIYRHDKAKTLLKEHHYLDQAIVMPDGDVNMTPAFDDMIELPAGAYRVELTLYAVPPNFQFKRVKFGQEMKMAASVNVSDFQKIVITEE